jgi:7-cyano-7-deazaguanine synthase
MGEQADVVLFSGGIDSSLVALLLAESKPELVFVDYGQPAREAERRATETLAEGWGFRLSETRLSGLKVGHGEITGRNSLLVHLGLCHRPDAQRIHIGIHAGTGYRDCSPDFVRLAQSSLDFHTGGTMRLSAPLLHLSKAEIVRLARSMELPFAMTHSCERGNRRCGKCPTCQDLEVLGVG